MQSCWDLSFSSLSSSWSHFWIRGDWMCITSLHIAHVRMHGLPGRRVYLPLDLTEIFQHRWHTQKNEVIIREKHLVLVLLDIVTMLDGVPHTFVSVNYTHIFNVHATKLLFMNNEYWSVTISFFPLFIVGASPLKTLYSNNICFDILPMIPMSVLTLYQYTLERIIERGMKYSRLAFCFLIEWCFHDNKPTFNY